MYVCAARQTRRHQHLNVALSRRVLTRLFARPSNPCHDNPEYGWEEREKRE